MRGGCRPLCGRCCPAPIVRWVDPQSRWKCWYSLVVDNCYHVLTAVLGYGLVFFRTSGQCWPLREKSDQDGGSLSSILALSLHKSLFNPLLLKWKKTARQESVIRICFFKVNYVNLFPLQAIENANWQLKPARWQKARYDYAGCFKWREHLNGGS